MTAPVFELTEPVLFVVNDADDDLWQLIGSSDVAAEVVSSATSITPSTRIGR